MKIKANAKINIGLNVVSKRPDGYHNLETVFYPVDMCDYLEITPATDDETTLQVKGIQVDSSMRDNLVYKAYMLLKQDFDIAAVNIVLEKNVPFGAGLGGGSSDAANTLKALNTMFSLGLTDEQLEQYAVRLGADCPFFIKNKPVYATGIGNEFHPIELDLSGYRIEVVKPDVNVSTAVAYRGIKPRPSDFNLLNINQLPLSEWKNCVKNDFEASVFPLFPEIKVLKEDMYRKGAVYAAMSGSGSAVFGIFKI
ncbi:MAG: 4-(cytidine 5'-diphospho)-2-C-methyl-D-erythritol kinase [Paludibacteraceae bacterium]|nr:4-(cytidine 5'-diphospho)-2-C-methyl-D-erythritol kinase [Paludibacteraceae bacterium]